METAPTEATLEAFPNAWLKHLGLQLLKSASQKPSNVDVIPVITKAHESGSPQSNENLDSISQLQIQKFEFISQFCIHLFCELDLSRPKPDPEESPRVIILVLITVGLSPVCCQWGILSAFFSKNFKWQVNGTEKKVSEKLKTCPLKNYAILPDCWCCLG